LRRFAGQDMTSEQKNRLLEIASRFSPLRAVVIGDLILDRYVWGRVDRISPEAPVPIVSVQSNEDRLGGAANAANNFAVLGVRTELAGVVGEDSERASLFSLLRSANILADGVVTDRNRPTTLKTRVMGQRQQLLRIDRESAAPAITVADKLIELAKSSLTSSDLILISDYGKGALTKEFFVGLNKQIAALGSAAPLIALDPHPTNYANYNGFDIAKPNKKEAEAASGLRISDLESAAKAANKLRMDWNCSSVIVSLSEDGLVVSGSEGAFHLPTIVRDVFDVSGAGDTLTAVVSASLAAGATLIEGTTLGIIAASNVVGKLGTATISAAELCHDIELLFTEKKIPTARPLGNTFVETLVPKA
jgi:rfaE bifunctional protein kinase chain/domain